MIYPQKLNNKKGEKIVNALLATSILIAILLVVINKITTPNVAWAGIANVGIIYIWITVIYSIRRNTNIASHVLLQMLVISFVLLYIDNRLGAFGWSIYIGIPITLMVANITMLVLAIVSYRNYTKYAIYQLIIVLVSIIQVAPASLMGIIKFGVLNQISVGISLLNLVISLALSYKDFGKILACKFHM
ncbi:MAG: hypothetical protein IJE59_00380 [Clostridia bacterium]|nr:hypothetical protein [Clostridia bacterium]